MSDHFIRILVKNLPSSLEDLFTQVCFDFGAEGVSEDLKFSQTSLRYEPEVLETELHDMNVFFSAMPGEDFFLKVQALASGLAVEKNVEENKDWLEEWKKGYEPFCLAGSHWVVPSWRKKPAEAEYAIYIDPGMAFGTGTHATTQLASQLILRNQKDLPENFSMIDVGTGTGILAMLAMQAGAGSVLGTEIDEQARLVARENCQRNGLAEIDIPDLQVEQIDRQFDLVVANIIDGILLDLKPALIARMRNNGRLVLTGILAEREPGFVKEFLADSGLEIAQRASKDEWIGLVLKRI